MDRWLSENVEDGLIRLNHQLVSARQELLQHHNTDCVLDFTDVIAPLKIAAIKPYLFQVAHRISRYKFKVKIQIGIERVCLNTVTQRYFTFQMRGKEYQWLVLPQQYQEDAWLQQACTRKILLTLVDPDRLKLGLLIEVYRNIIIVAADQFNFLWEQATRIKDAFIMQGISILNLQEAMAPSVLLRLHKFFIAENYVASEKDYLQALQNKIQTEALGTKGLLIKSNKSRKGGVRQQCQITTTITRTIEGMCKCSTSRYSGPKNRPC